MLDKSLSTAQITSVVRTYSPHNAHLLETAAQKRRAFISFIVSRERSKRAAQEGLRCYSLDILSTPRATSALSYRTSSRRPKFVFSHSGNNIEKEQRDRESRLKDDCSSNSVLPPTAATSNKNGSSTFINGFRPMNSRNNFLGGQGIAPLHTSQQQQPQQQQQRAPHLSSNTSSSHSRDSEDLLVATGTSTLQPACSPTRKPSAPANNIQSSSSTSSALDQMGVASRKFSRASKTNTSYGPSGTIRSKDLTEPRYGDPLHGGPATFQQRLAEINSLEQETIRFERSKKFKKKQSKSET